MIEKMTFLSISGPRDDIDRVVDEYLRKFPMHLENALSELSSARDLYPFSQNDPYREWLSLAESYTFRIEGSPDMSRELSIEEAVDVMREVRGEVNAAERELPELREKFNKAQDLLTKLMPFKSVTAGLSDIFNFRFIKVRLGRVPRDFSNKFETYVYNDQNIIFVRTQEDDDYVWGICFIPKGHVEKAEAKLSSLHFERIRLPDSYPGTAAEAYEDLRMQCMQLSGEIQKIQEKSRDIINGRAGRILRAKEVLARRSEQFAVRKLAACTKERESTYYILCGWMTEKDAQAFIEAVKDDSKVSIIEESASEFIEENPPTKLKNPAIIKPFEMFIRMYGIPAYNEIDPTLLVALTYSFLFGAMFGDLGQGLLLLIGGALLYKTKKMPLAGIISTAGFFSSVFGVLYGSFFGFENVIPALWIKPGKAMLTIPVIGTLNMVLVVAIAFGMFMVLITMVLHIINAARAGRRGDELFDTNGIAGLLFYSAVVAAVVLIMTGRKLPGAILMAVLIGLPTAAFAFKEPLENLVEKKKPLISDTPGMFIMQTFFELFETMLSFFSNTLSFVRVGAFAISHAAMMEVVLMLAGAENGGSINWIVVILGNLFVCALEGLVVGIQVLRLEYYELFSRFYRGDGREFKPFMAENKESARKA